MAIFKKKQDLPADKLSLPLEINYGQWSKVFSHLLLVVSVLVSSLIALASFAPIHEIVVAEGQIIPSGNIIETQHLDGGIVSSVNVKEGDFVQSGDILMRVSAHDVETDLRKSKAQRVALEIERTRMNALIAGNRPVFDGFDRDHANTVRDQTALFEAENRAHHADMTGAELVIAQKQSELSTIHSETLKHQAEIELRKARLSVLQGLFKKGLTTQDKVLDAKLGHQDSELRYERSQGALVVAGRKVSEAQSQRENTRATRRSQWIAALSEIEKKITNLVQTMESLNLKLNRQEVLAPAAGIVQTLAARHPGEVIRPGEVTVQLVPVTDRIEVKVNVPPEHIGHVSVGSEARVMLTAYDNETYGYANGKISVLSPTTTRNDRGEYYYTAKLNLDRQQLDSFAGTKPILPGMIAQAEIYTGTKSLMKYLLKPVYRSVGKAFSER